MPIDSSVIISGFVSKVVNDCMDVLKEKIKDADKDRKSYEQNMETRIYQVTIDALNEFTSDRYKGEDSLYDSAESILNGVKNSKIDKIDAVIAGLKMLGLQETTDTGKEFLKSLCHEISKDENDILYKEIAMFQQGQMLEGMSNGFSESQQKAEKTLEILDEIKEDTGYIRGFLDGKEGNEAETYNEIHIANRTKEYADRWDKNVFLNDFSEWDENVGTNIKLRDLYLEEHLPHYIWKANKNPRNDLKDLLKEYIVDSDKRRMLLILGLAGIGKSTLITWILSNIVEQKDQILVYQFASDLKNVNWTEDNIFDEIVKKIGLKSTELEGKTLILDGFDEIYANRDKERILNKLNQELKVMNILQRFSLIIYCRENYINQSYLGNIEYIILQAWNEEQIKSFCGNYEKKSARKNFEVLKSSIFEMKINKILENKEIFGIPLILYMVLALNVDIEETSSKVEIYDQIFSLKRGGIYDRCYDIEHRINAPEIKKHIHRISQRIAFWMFENNADEAFISQEKFEEICENEMSESGKKGEEIQRDALIGNFFKLNYCEGKETDEIQFVHRSIYEYFVAVYFFESIHKLTSKEEVAGKLGDLLKDGQLSKQILEFIRCKFGAMKGYQLTNTIKKIFQLMLRDGMNYHVGVPVLNIMDREMNIFSNMLEILSLFDITIKEYSNKIVSYLQYNKKSGLKLKGIKLSSKNKDIDDLLIEIVSTDLDGVYLRGADLRGADLSEVDLRRAVLFGADLRGANLRGANLTEADLRGTDLSEADLCETDLFHIELKEANLSETLFGERQVNMICEKYDLSGSRVALPGTGEIISYEEYCARKKAKREVF